MRVAFRKTKIRDNKYIIQLNCDEEEKVFEIAKILSGVDNPSTKFIENAKELLLNK